jgi:hypothetical protein
MGRRPEFVHIIDTGQVVLTRESHPSWRGRHNQVKSKILLQLYSVWSKGDDTGLCLAELVKLTGTSPTSLHTLLPRWTRWHYIRRKAKIFNNKPVFSYLIDMRGRRFIELRLPQGKREQFIAEIKISRIAVRLTNTQREVN